MLSQPFVIGFCGSDLLLALHATVIKLRRESCVANTFIGAASQNLDKELLLFV